MCCSRVSSWSGRLACRDSRDCEHAGEPDLTALVIDQQTHLPGSFNEAPVEPGSLNESRWKDELVRIRTYDWPLE